MATTARTTEWLPKGLLERLQKIAAKFPKGCDSEDNAYLSKRDVTALDNTLIALENSARTLTLLALRAASAARDLEEASALIDVDGFIDAEGMGWLCYAIEDLQGKQDTGLVELMDLTNYYRPA